MIAAGIAGQPLLRCAEAEGTELTGGPGWQRRGGGNARLRAGAGWWGRARSGRGRRGRERAAERSARAEALAGGLGRCAAGLERPRREGALHGLDGREPVGPGVWATGWAEVFLSYFYFLSLF